MKKIISSVIICIFLSTSSHAEGLTKDEIKTIAKQYIEACENKDFHAWKRLFKDVGDSTEEAFNSIRIKNLEQIRIKEIDGYNVCLQMQEKYHKYYGWLQILPNGKIKYGPILYNHPVVIAFRSQHRLRLRFGGDPDNFSDQIFETEALLKTGIPTFGLKRRGKANEQEKSVEQIREWLIENGEHWDYLEPKIPCPEDQFKECLKKYK